MGDAQHLRKPGETGPQLVRRRGAAWWGSLRYNVSFWWVMVVDLVLWATVHNQAWYPDDFYPATAELERNWPAIRAELDAVLDGVEDLPTFQEVDHAQRRVSDDDRWRLFILRFVGQDNEGNRSRCPITSSLVDQVPGMWTAMFSVLAPGKTTPWHSGGIKGVLRYHLGMIIPDEQACTMQIFRHGRRQWREGRSLVFDDTYLHRAANPTDRTRVVLWLDIERPIDRPRIARLNRWCLRRMASSDRLARAIDNATVDTSAVAQVGLPSHLA